MRSGQQLVACGAGVGVGQVGIPVANASLPACKCKQAGLLLQGFIHAPSPRGHFYVCVHLLCRAFTTASCRLQNLTTIWAFLPLAFLWVCQLPQLLCAATSGCTSHAHHHLVGWLNAAYYYEGTTRVQRPACNWGMLAFASSGPSQLSVAFECLLRFRTRLQSLQQRSH